MNQVGEGRRRNERTVDEGPVSEGCETTTDAFLGGALEVMQPRRGYRAGLDAVLLAATVVADASNGAVVEGAMAGGTTRVLDLGAGVGVVGLAVARRLARADVTLLERQPELTRLARANIERNELGARVRVVEGDLLAKGAHRTLLDGATFECSLANPPYYTEGAGTPARNPVKAGSHAMAADELERWVRFLAGATAAGGEATIIFRADALASLLASLEGRFGGISVLPVHAHPGAPAVRVIVRGRKGSRAPMSLLAGLVLHDYDGRVRPEIEAILRQGAALSLAKGQRRRSADRHRRVPTS